QAYSDINKDEAFYMPENLINIAQQHQIFQSVPILDAFVEYDDLSEYVRIDALKTSENLKPNIKRLKKIFSKYKNGNEIEVKIAHTAVGLLASNHKDNSSVLWILRAAKANAFENVDTLSSKYRPVGVFDRDIREGDLIQPLKNVDDPIYVEEYLKLLDFSFELIGRGITWHNYAAYLWSAIDQYFNNLVVKGDYSYFDALEKRVQDFNNVVSTAPYIRHLNFIKGNYLQSLSKPKLFISSLQVLNKYKSETVDSIVSELDLHNKVIEVIEKDLIRWVDNEGRKILGYDEVSAQRSIAIIMENFFLKRGFKKEEVSRNNITFLREAQAVDDTRTDFLIYSGFIGPEVIELKRSSHNDLSGDIEKKKSFMSLEKYIKQFDAENAIFLVYETKNRSKAYWDRHLKKIDHIYSKIKGVKVIGMRNEYSLKKLYSKKKK
ncbi:hypothetical protein HY312_00390, partial [Candidatus Saccharibacteria bacterium]|nr:hypothetical protein [Candidatus Saccharibacteria bacterium]